GVNLWPVAPVFCAAIETLAQRIAIAVSSKSIDFSRFTYRHCGISPQVAVVGFSVAPAKVRLRYRAIHFGNFIYAFAVHIQCNVGSAFGDLITRIGSGPVGGVAISYFTEKIDVSLFAYRKSVGSTDIVGGTVVGVIVGSMATELIFYG